MQPDAEEGSFRDPRRSRLELDLDPIAPFAGERIGLSIESGLRDLSKSWTH